MLDFCVATHGYAAASSSMYGIAVRMSDTMRMMSFRVRRVRSETPPSKLLRMVRVGLPLLRIYAVLRRHASEMNTSVRPSRRRLQRITMLLAALVLALLIVLGALALVIRLKAVAFDVVTLAGAEIPADDDGHTNILLLGKGDDDHDGIDLTDTIMLASIDAEKTRSVVLLSIPRDTYLLSTQRMGRGRINSLYRDYKIALRRQGRDDDEAAREALRELGEEIGAQLGITVHGVVLVNFSGFVQIVDELGGVEVDVPQTIVDPEYPGPQYTYETFRIEAGHHLLDGSTALKYVRSRHTTSDFSRSARQQQVLSALAHTIEQQGLIRHLGRVSDILSILAENFESTFTSRELLGIASLGRSIDPSRLLSVQLSDRNGLYGTLAEPGGLLYAPPREEFEGASVLLPVSIPEFPVTWKQVQSFTHLLTTQRALFLRPSSIAVLNAGAPSGAARSLANEMLRYAFGIDSVQNLGRRGKDDRVTSSIVVRPLPASSDAAATARSAIARATATFLGATLGIPVLTTDDPLAFQDHRADIALILGKEYHYVPLQDLL